MLLSSMYSQSLESKGLSWTAQATGIAFLPIAYFPRGSACKAAIWKEGAWLHPRWLATVAIITHSRKPRLLTPLMLLSSCISTISGIVTQHRSREGEGAHEREREGEVPSPSRVQRRQTAARASRLRTVPRPQKRQNQLKEKSA
ncbi:unnamed protein product [Pleuronectes platessa]|uniref:Uncharacterized protein n=1 Tax=Pleuronectes platessa TaxID=8262 RepID=A0A9N7TWE4_PLEPL|nr:unnamed protein product [Pleuronectes platessa]